MMDPRNSSLELSRGDALIMLTLVKTRIRQQEKAELKSQTDGTPFPGKARFQMKRLRSLQQSLERIISEVKSKRTT